MAIRGEVSWNGLSDDETVSPIAREAESILRDRAEEEAWEEEFRERQQDQMSQFYEAYTRTELTARQRECIEAYLDREEQTVTAKRLGISQPTVNEHLQAAFRKLRKRRES